MTPKVVLVTGATSDIGAAIAQRFARAGTQKFYLHGRNQDKLDRLSKTLSAQVIPLLCDLSNRQAVRQTFEALHDVELLVNNAGGALGLDKAQNANLDDLTNMIDANVTALVQVTTLLLPHMVKQGHGHIINIGSVAGSWPYPGGHVYCASKAFVRQYTLALRADLLDTGVRATCIEPGMVESSFSLKRFKGNEEKARAVYAGTSPLTPDDVAEAVFFSATLPAHVSVTSLEIMPSKQANGPLLVQRS